MKSLFFYALLFMSPFLLAAQEDNAYPIGQLKVLEVNTSINPAVFNYLERHIKKAQKKELILIKLNTPGGLVSTTKEILTLIGDSDVPIAIWITPEGASATSAGSIIASAAHLLFMSEGTNIGAATPIGMGSDIKEKDARSKAINDLVALVKSLAVARGRNPEPFSKMISEAKSLSAKEALKENVIDAIIHGQNELIQKLNNRLIHLKGKSYILKPEALPKIITQEMDLGQKILNVFADPSTAYILFIIGAALIYFEMQAPGGFIAGGIGALCLALAGIGFQVLPLNIGAMGLLLLAFILFILEVYITSFGLLTIAAIASLTFGSLFLFRTDNSFIAIEQTVIFSTVFAIAVYIIFLGWFFLKTRQKEKFYKEEIVEEGSILKVLDTKENGLTSYQVKFNGEIWKTESSLNFKTGEEVLITHINNDTLEIQIKKQ